MNIREVLGNGPSAVWCRKIYVPTPISLDQVFSEVELN
jgi:hypothetical protein